MTGFASTFTGQLQTAWSSSSLGDLKKCPRYYYLRKIEGWSPKDESVHLKFGGFYASALELFHVERANGLSYEDATRAVVRYLFEQTHGWTSDFPKKTPYTLFRSVLWYLDAYRDDPAETVILDSGKPAVELTFQFESGFHTPAGEPYVLWGKLDRLVSFLGDHYIMDQKTTGGALGSFYFRQFSPDNQMSLYSVASKIAYNFPVKGVIIDAAQINVGFTVFDRGITTRTDAMLDEWLGGFQDWTKMAETYALRGSWPMNEASCGNYGGCAFRGVCDKDPSVRDYFLSTSFEKLNV